MGSKTLLLATVLIAFLGGGCQKAGSDKKEEAPPSTATPVQPSPPVEKLLLESRVNFLYTNDELTEGFDNKLGFVLQGAREVHVRYSFRFSEPRFVKILAADPLLSCQDAKVSPKRIYLKTKDWSRDVTSAGMLAVDAETDYTFEIVQNAECKRGTGLYQAVIWLGKADQAAQGVPALAVVCKGNGRVLTSFVGGEPAIFMDGKPYFNRTTFCGQESSTALACSRTKAGFRETIRCDSHATEARSFQMSYDGSGRASDVQCVADGQPVDRQHFDRCAVKVLNRSDY
jgi:hypothetical protein